MHGFVCGTVKISSAFISKALVRPKLWKNLATRWSTSRIWTTLEPTTWTWTKPEMKLGVLQKITAGSACTNTHTHTQIHIFLRTHTRTHTYTPRVADMVNSLSRSPAFYSTLNKISSRKTSLNLPDEIWFGWLTSWVSGVWFPGFC